MMRVRRGGWSPIESQAKVEHYQATGIIDEHVSGLEISMKLASLVNRIHRVDQLQQHSTGAIRGRSRGRHWLESVGDDWSALASHVLIERHSLDQVHREVSSVVFDEQFVKPHEVRVNDLAQCPKLLFQGVRRRRAEQP
jgi:hypothetical protein